MSKLEEKTCFVLSFPAVMENMKYETRTDQNGSPKGSGEPNGCYAWFSRNFS